MNRKILTLCIVHDREQVLLGLKKRGFGAGRWNGFGGKVEPGESVEDAARREIWEEAGIKVAGIEKAGHIEFEFIGEPSILEVHIFRAVSFEGEPAESEEMRPQWFHINDIPFDRMWPDDRYWFPMFLAGQRFKGKFVFMGQDNIIEHNLEEIKQA